jgi:hypothetical protein
LTASGQVPAIDAGLYADPCIPPDQRIDQLVQLLASPPEGIDVAAHAGLLGLAWLELYERDGDEEALSAGLACLRETISTDRDHPDRTRWLYWVGLAYGERGRRTGSVEDYHLAIDYVSALHAGLPPEDPDRPRVAATLIELCWERYWFVRHGPRHDPDQARGEVDRLVARVAPLMAGESDPARVRQARVIVGLAHLERYDLGARRSDLDRGIALLAASSLWDLPSDLPRPWLAGAELARAYQRRALLDDDRASLELAIRAGERTIELACRSDRVAWLMAHHNQALAYEARWRRFGERMDLDHAITCWQVLLEDGDGRVDAWEAIRAGGLMRTRGELTGDARDVAAATELLNRVHRPPGDGRT